MLERRIERSDSKSIVQSSYISYNLQLVASFLASFIAASIDFEFSSPAGTYGVYHSIYDSFDWIDNFGGTVGEVGSR